MAARRCQNRGARAGRRSGVRRCSRTRIDILFCRFWIGLFSVCTVHQCYHFGIACTSCECERFEAVKKSALPPSLFPFAACCVRISPIHSFESFRNRCAAPRDDASSAERSLFAPPPPLCPFVLDFDFAFLGRTHRPHHLNALHPGLGMNRSRWHQDVIQQRRRRPAAARHAAAPCSVCRRGQQSSRLAAPHLAGRPLAVEPPAEPCSHKRARS